MEVKKIKAIEKKWQKDLETLRDMRHKLMEPSEARLDQALTTDEVAEPKTKFDKKSFSTICPKCPEGRCELCAPDLIKDTTKVIVGCPTGHYKNGKCDIALKVHKIIRSE